jgi:tetratricopeptide (TPR) repeat protein
MDPSARVEHTPREASDTEHLRELGYVDPQELELQATAELRRHEHTLQRAKELVDAGKPFAAVEALEELIAAMPGWTAPRRLMVRAAYMSGRRDQALAQLDWLDQHGLELAELALLRGLIELSQRRFDDALESAEYARCLQAPLPAADLLIGQAHLRRGRLEEAEQSFRDVLLQESSNAQAWGGLGAIKLRRGEYEQAVECCLNALEGNMQAATVHFRLGMALTFLERWTEATTALEAAIVLNPRLAGPLRWLSRIALHQGDAAAARARLDQGREVVRRRPRQQDRN